MVVADGVYAVPARPSPFVPRTITSKPSYRSQSAAFADVNAVHPGSFVVEPFPVVGSYQKADGLLVAVVVKPLLLPPVPVTSISPVPVNWLSAIALVNGCPMK